MRTFREHLRDGIGREGRGRGVFRTRARNVILSFVLAALVPLGPLADATAIGTLFAFALVNVAVVVLRRSRPDLPRAFRVPGAPVTPILGVPACAYLMFSMSPSVWAAFLVWPAVGMIVYFGYSMRRSRLETEPTAAPLS